MASVKVVRVIGPHGPFLPEDIERLRQVFLTLPTYREEDGTIDAESDLAELFKQVGWHRTEEELRSYKEAYNTVGGFAGRAPLAVMIPVLEVLHVTEKFVEGIIKACDQNKDGFIQKDEFGILFKILQLHYPEWNIEYERFAEEADTNKDGKVSVEEAVDWIEKWVAKHNGKEKIAESA